MKPTLLLPLLFALALWPLLSLAQDKKGEVRGRLVGAVKKEPLPYATVTVYSAQDTTLITFRMSDEKGQFRVPGLPLEKQIRVVVTMVGLGVHRKELTLTPEQPVADLGTIVLEASSQLLGEVLIVAETPPILFRNDTLEFNASSFKTLPTSLVEDLLKKLPGVTVDGSGNISVNGKAVSRILVDGKEFFGSDPKVASRNLPADVIDKVQVMKDPEALLRDPDLPEAEIPQVINLKFKKGVKKGMFGKLYAGAGTDHRHEGGGILNIFRDTTQISLLGYSNNLNRPGFGFEDVSRIGGFNRSGMSSMMIRSDGGFAVNGISFGGTDEGIQRSAGAGTNFNTLLKNGLKLNFQYFFGGIDADLDQVVNSAQLLGRDTLSTRRTRDQFSRNGSHRLGGKLEWKLDSLTTLSITPSLSLTHRTHSQRFYINTFYSPSALVNESDNRQVSDEATTSSSNQVYLTRNFHKKGRNFYFFGNYEYNNAVQEQLNSAVNTFYRPAPYTTLLDQLRDSGRQGLSLNSSAGFTEPISKSLSATLRLNSDYFRDRNELYTLEKDLERQEYSVPVPGLSNGLTRSGWRNYLTAGLRWKIKGITLNPSLRFTSLEIANAFERGADIGQSFFYVYPGLNLNWKQLHLSYNVNLREPNAADLQPVPDNTNPLFIQYGNPGLRPSVINSFNLNYRKHDAKRSLNYNAYANASISSDAVTRERTVSTDGVQTSRPVNTDGNWSLNGSGRVHKDYKYSGNRQFSLGGSLRFSYMKTLILLNDISSFGQTYGLYPSLEARMNLNDKLELNQALSLNGQRSYYEDQAFDNLQFTTRASKTEIVVRVPRKLVWEATFDYWYNSNAVPGLQQSYGRLNGAVTYLFLKNDRAQLKLSSFDLLNQNISAYRTIRENLVEDYQTVVLNRYFLLTFTYNIRNFGGKVGGSNPIFRF